MERNTASESHTVTARDLVTGYIDALGAVGAAMRAASVPLERPADVLGLVRSRRIIAGRGRIGTYSYQVHGTGCLFTREDGTEIDTDFTGDGREIFDLWRLRRYAQTLPEPRDPAEQDLRSAVESLKPLPAEVRPGWFTVTGARPAA